jgi:hypothetical protein
LVNRYSSNYKVIVARAEQAAYYIFISMASSLITTFFWVAKVADISLAK